jgi:hypothetical protein
MVIVQTGGNQRELARAKNAKKHANDNKGAKLDGTTLQKKMERYVHPVSNSVLK